MFRRAILVGDDLVEIPAAETHHVFMDRTGINGVRIRMRTERVSVYFGMLNGPEELPGVFSTLNVNSDDYKGQMEAWLHEHKALMSIYPNGFSIDWYA